MKEFNCHTCKSKRTLPGDCHISCQKGIAALLTEQGNVLGIKGNEHGIKNGWFAFPFNYDPIWLENCNGYEKIEGEK